MEGTFKQCLGQQLRVSEAIQAEGSLSLGVDGKTSGGALCNVGLECRVCV